MKRIFADNADLRTVGAALLVSLAFFLTMYGFFNHLSNEFSSISSAAAALEIDSSSLAMYTPRVGYIDQYQDYLEYIPKQYA